MQKKRLATLELLVMIFCMLYKDQISLGCLSTKYEKRTEIEKGQANCEAFFYTKMLSTICQKNVDLQYNKTIKTEINLDTIKFIYLVFMHEMSRKIGKKLI